VERQDVVGRLLVRRQLGGEDVVWEDLERGILVGSNLERSNLVGSNLEREWMVGRGVGWVRHALGAVGRSVGEHALG
jgi:hypothetical protein